MTLKTLAAAVCLSIAGANTASATPVDFNFSFTDGTNTIKGLIEGLDSDGLGQAASAITVFGVADTYVLASSDLISNSFDVSGSVIDSSTASASGFTDTGSFFLDFVLQGTLPFFGADEDSLQSNNQVALVTASSIDFTPVAAVPLPAGGLLLLSAFGGVAALKRRKKRAA